MQWLLMLPEMFTLRVYSYERILRISGGAISTFAGNGACQYYSAVSLASPFVCGVESLTFDAAGNLYLMEVNVIYEISQGTVTTVSRLAADWLFSRPVSPVDMAGELIHRRYRRQSHSEALERRSNHGGGESRKRSLSASMKLASWGAGPATEVRERGAAPLPEPARDRLSRDHLLHRLGE